MDSSQTTPSSPRLPPCEQRDTSTKSMASPEWTDESCCQSDHRGRRDCRKGWNCPLHAVGKCPDNHGAHLCSYDPKCSYVLPKSRKSCDSLRSTECQDQELAQAMSFLSHNGFGSDESHDSCYICESDRSRDPHPDPRHGSHPGSHHGFGSDKSHDQYRCSPRDSYHGSPPDSHRTVHRGPHRGPHRGSHRGPHSGSRRDSHDELITSVFLQGVAAAQQAAEPRPAVVPMRDVAPRFSLGYHAYRHPGTIYLPGSSPP